jgi:phosphomethylpyrimidine synthase
MTQLEYAQGNTLTPLVKRIAKDEGVSPKQILRLIAEGKIVIPLNKTHKIKKPCGIGCGLKTKINANIGTSTDKSEIKDELEKLAVAVKYGADTVMDLSVGGDLKRIRKEI